MKTPIVIGFCTLLAAAACVVSQEEQIPSDVPLNGFVPDEKTAIAIAEAVWTHMYGKDRISKERPFKAVLTNDIWTVRGSLPTGHKGGVAVAEISKKSGCIVRVIHGK